MPKYTRNTGEEWTLADDRMLRELAAQYTPTRVIALKLRRTEAAVYSRASELNISLGTRKTRR
jgi:hypothetical protein